MVVEKGISKDNERELKEKEEKMVVQVVKKERERKMREQWEKGKNIFLSISRIDGGKGQVFLNNRCRIEMTIIIKKKNYSITQFFF